MEEISLTFYVTNYTVQESTPYVFGVTADGTTVGVKMTHMPYAIYVEMGHHHADADENKTRDWLQSRVRPFLERQDRRSTYFRPALQVVQRRKLCGYHDNKTWFVKVLYDSAEAARRDAYDLRKKFLGCHVYHERLDPHLVFTAHTGLRCFTWVTMGARNGNNGSTRCDLNLCCDVKYIQKNDDDHPPPHLNVCAFDLETDGLRWDAGDEIRMISISCDGRDFLLTRHSLGGSEQKYCVVDCDDEKDLIVKFVGIVHELRPVFLTGWNIFGFDLQFLFERATALRVFPQTIETLSWLAVKKVKPVVKEMSSNAFGQNKVYHDTLEGVITLDGYILARKGTKMPSYSLKAFGEWIGEAKGDVSYDDMVEAFRTKDPLRMRNVADYCVQDSRLVLKILHRMEEPQKVMAMTRLAAVPPMYTIKRGQSILTFGLILAETFHRQWVVNPSAAKSAGDQDGYKGATVIDPIRGYHKDPVAVLDFESLYPSIMQAYNICISTYISTYAATDAGLQKYQFPEYSVIEIEDNACVVFRRTGDEGVFPSILRVLLARRKDVKRQMTQWTVGSTEYNQANAKQLSLKVAANSLYGYLGSPVSHLYNKDLAASVTSMGRQSLFQVRTVIEKLCRDGRIPPQVHVVYGDSVTGDTPLVLRMAGRIVVQCIGELEGEWKPYHGTKEAFVPPSTTPWYVWQDGGFTRIRRVIRHYTRKTILRVMTPCGMVDCTEDHSLLRANGTKVSPNAANLGDKLLHYECTVSPPKTLEVVNAQDAFERGVYNDEDISDILQASLEVVGAYWEGLGHYDGRCYTKKMATYVMLLASRIGIAMRLRIHDETTNLVSLHDATTTSSRVEKIDYIGLVSQDYRDYVYDLETHNHHFGVGPGSLVVHNTDSVMVKFPGVTPTEAHDLATFVEKECTQTFTKPLRLEFENLFVTYVLENKKRYAGRVWSPSGEHHPPVTVIKGLCVKRRDFPKIVQDGLSGILDILLRGGDDAPSHALAFIENILESIATNQVSLDKLCITKELNKNIHGYKTPPPHLVVSQKMARRNPNDPPKAGDRITFVVMYGNHGKGNISDRAEAYDYVQQHMPGAKCDVEYYASQLASQCENMMTLCGKGSEFQRLVLKYTTMARLHSEGQHKLSRFFTPTSSSSSIAVKQRIAGGHEEEQPPPPKKQQTSLHKWFSKA